MDEAWNSITLPVADELVLAGGTRDLTPVDALVPDPQLYEETAHSGQFYSAHLHYNSVQVQADTAIIGQVENLTINDSEPLPPPVPSRRREIDSTVNRALRAELTLPADRQYSSNTENSNRLLSAIHEYKDDKVKSLLLKRTDPSLQGWINYSTFTPIHLALTEYEKTSSSSKRTRCAATMKYLIRDLGVRLPKNETLLTALAAKSGPHSLLAIMWRSCVRGATTTS